MYLNDFAEGLESRDMSRSDELASLLASASDLGIPHDPGPGRPEMVQVTY